METVNRKRETVHGLIMKIRPFKMQYFEAFNLDNGKIALNDLFGVTNPKLGLILVNYQKPLYYKIYTLFHERIHEINAKINGLTERRAKLDGFWDICDYCFDNFQIYYKDVLNSKLTLFQAFHRVLNRYSAD